MLAVGCLLSVSIAVITISVIQFQVRLHEARTQSRDFALATVIQMAEFEKSIEDTIKIVTDLGPGALQFYRLTQQYTQDLSQAAQSICSLGDYRKPDSPFSTGYDTGGCFQRFLSVATTSNVKADDIKNFLAVVYVDAVITDRKNDIDYYATQVNRLALTRNDKLKTNIIDNIMSFELACDRLRQFVGIPELEQPDGGIGLTARGDELRGAAKYLTSLSGCFDRGDKPQATQTTAEGIQPINTQGGGADLTPAATAPLAPNSSAAGRARDDVNRTLISDLVAYYRFYSGFISFFPQVVLAPLDFTFILLVVVAGALGSMLRLAYQMGAPRDAEALHTRMAALRNLVALTWSYILFRVIIGIMCALVIYIVSRTSFVALTERSFDNQQASISPFVITFLSVVSGLMAEEVFARIAAMGRRALDSINSNEPPNPAPQADAGH